MIGPLQLLPPGRENTKGRKGWYNHDGKMYDVRMYWMHNYDRETRKAYRVLLVKAIFETALGR
jgi:hypothetical protein